MVEFNHFFLFFLIIIIIEIRVIRTYKFDVSICLHCDFLIDFSKPFMLAFLLKQPKNQSVDHHYKRQC